MATTPSKQWELIGIVSYGRGCGNHEYSGGYTRVAAYEEFIQSVMNGTYIKPIPWQCTCQCPYGAHQGVAYTSKTSSEGCVAACIALSASRCTTHNTYACLGANCTYSSAYVNSTSPVEMGRYICSCQCPYGNDQGLAFTKRNSSEACVDACTAVLFNGCTEYNTYACLNTSCAYSSGYAHSTSPVVSSQYRCSCQCPFGNDQGVAYASINLPQACVSACIGVMSNQCVTSNTYACLGASCVYSRDYAQSTSSAARDRFLCSCECPYGNDQGVAFAKENSTEACICACRASLTNLCVGYNTYACLGTECAYSSSYNYSLAAVPSIYRCACQCPYGVDQGSAYATDNSSQACVDACRAVLSYPCHLENTYACLGTSCSYSAGYVNSTLPVVSDQYRCSCQCPYGTDQGLALATRNSSEACVDACGAVSSNPCTLGNTYACLGTECAFSTSYVHKCSCQCPFGSIPSLTYTFGNTTDACVDA